MTEKPMSKSRFWGMILAFFLVTTLLPGAILFGVAGRLDWTMGWVFLLSASAVSAGSRLVLAFIAPDVLRERGRFASNDNVKSWDKALVPVLGIILPLAIIAISALDWRFRWSPSLPPAVSWIAFGVFVAAMLFGSWALIANRFFSSHVRIQTERGHTVVSSGPYRLVRHPGYASALLMYAAIPILLDGVWGLTASALYVIGFLIRTALEDRTLHQELDGYAAYAQRVRYRLLPGVW